MKKRGGIDIAVIFNFLRRVVVFFTALISLLGIQTTTVTVELYSNPASGYNWEYSFDKNGILTMNDTHYKPDPASILTGRGGGTRYFVLRSIGSGTVRVTFEYVKTTESERIVASKYIYTYNVATDGKITLSSIQ